MRLYVLPKFANGNISVHIHLNNNFLSHQLTALKYAVDSSLRRTECNKRFSHG